MNLKTKLKNDTRFLRIFIAGIYLFICLLLLSIIIYLSSCKALGKTGVVVESVVFLLVSVILIAAIAVVIKIAFRSRTQQMEFSDRIHLILWGILLPVLFAFNLIIGLPFLLDCLEGDEITQQFLIREISMNSGRNGTVIVADADWENNFDPENFYAGVYDADDSIIYFHSGRIANVTFMKDFFEIADVSTKTRDWIMTSTDTQLLYATITYYPRTHAILAYQDVKIVPLDLTE